jgi:DNA-binding transcriptional MerR regulator
MSVKRMFYTISEVCAKFGVSAKTIDRWDKVGKLCYSTVTEGGCKLFCVSEVDALLELLKIEREKKYRGCYG